MTITQLRCFIAMAEELSFTRAARKLFVSQAAVSFHIKALEGELGAELLARSTRRVALTEVGAQFYREVAQAVHTIDAAYETVRLSTGQKSFSIGYSALCSGRRFRRIVSRFTEEWPALSVFLNIVEPEDNLFDQLLTDQIDVALFLNPFYTLPRGVAVRDYGEVQHMLMVPESHPLAARSTIRGDELPRHEIMAHTGIKRIERMESTMFERVVELRQGGRALPHNLESLLSMVRSGLCLARLPALDDIEQTGIRCLTVEEGEAAIAAGPKLVAAWHDTRISPQISRFCAIAAEEISCAQNL